MRPLHLLPLADAWVADGCSATSMPGEAHTYSFATKSIALTLDQLEAIDLGGGSAVRDGGLFVYGTG